MMLIIAMSVFGLSLFSTVIVLAACTVSSRADAAAERMQSVAKQNRRPRLRSVDSRLSAPMSAPLVVALKHK